MAPRKRKNDGEETAKLSTSTRVTRSMSRRTRSSTQQSGSNSTQSGAKLTQLKSPKKKKKQKTSKLVEKKGDKEQEVEEDNHDGSEKRTIVIEHCKQCNSFKTRAIQVKKGLEEGVSGISVILNPDKPRRGCFEIREDGGETFISLLDMKRPFTAMKALNMEEVIADIMKKIK